ncbi:MAG TPA: Fic family protein [Nitrosopumilus sp.]|nr:Fic family protein [Thermoproteota archaeon]HJJ22705.1 Fic family protein [Nitrosopumilus sp.]
MTIIYLNLEQVCIINQELLGSKSGFNYKGGMEFVLANVQTLYDELEEKDAVIGKCAYLWYSIASNQYLTNGNKRTGYLVAEDFLRLNKLRLNITEDEKLFVSKAIANNIYTIDHIRHLITKALKSD